MFIVSILDQITNEFTCFSVLDSFNEAMALLNELEYDGETVELDEINI